MNLFIETRVSPALAELTDAYRALDAKYAEAKQLYEHQQQLLSRKVDDTALNERSSPVRGAQQQFYDLHSRSVAGTEPVYVLRLREMATAELRVWLVQDELQSLFEPLKAAYLKAEKEVPGVWGLWNRNNVLCARDLYDCAAALLMEMHYRKVHEGSLTQLRSDYERRIQATDERRFAIRYDGQTQATRAPYLNAGELLMRIHGSKAPFTIEVYDPVKEELLHSESFKIEPSSTPAIEAVATAIAHLWFGDLVSAEGWKDLWLNEAFAENCGRLTKLAFKAKTGKPISEPELTKFRVKALKDGCSADVIDMLLSAFRQPNSRSEKIASQEAQSSDIVDAFAERWMGDLAKTDWWKKLCEDSSFRKAVADMAKRLAGRDPGQPVLETEIVAFWTAICSTGISSEQMLQVIKQLRSHWPS